MIFIEIPFQAMNKKKSTKDMGDLSMASMTPSGMNPLMSQMQGMGSEGSRGGGSSMMSMSNMMKGQGSGLNNMSEDEYVRVWENYSKMSGRPFDAQTVRGWYRQHKQYSAMSR